VKRRSKQVGPPRIQHRRTRVRGELKPKIHSIAETDDMWLRVGDIEPVVYSGHSV